VLWFGCGRQQKQHAAAPAPAAVQRRMERNRQKLVGRDKGSLTEQQTKGTGTTTIQKKQNTQNKPTEQSLQNTAALSRTATSRSRAASEFPPTRTQNDGTWYGIPCCVWSGGVSLPSYASSWIPVKIDPVLAKPRTICKECVISTSPCFS